MTADSEHVAYVLRIQNMDLERQLYGQRLVYVSIKRDWLQSPKLLFARRDVFIGSGTIDRFISTGELPDQEKRRCLENNCYGKIEFAKLARFYPTVAIEDTIMAGQNPLMLHGASLTLSDALLIERFARARLLIL